MKLGIDGSPEIASPATYHRPQYHDSNQDLTEIGAIDMSHWNAAHALGVIADTLESLTGRRGFYQEKHHYFPVHIGEVQIAFGNADIELIPLNHDGLLQMDSAFSLLAPLKHFTAGTIIVGLDVARLVIREEDADNLNKKLLAGATSAQSKEDIYLLERQEFRQNGAQSLASCAPVPLASKSTGDASTCAKGPRSNHVYLVITGDEIYLDALISSYGRFVITTDQVLHPVFLLLELAAKSAPGLSKDLIALERNYARSIGAKHPFIGESMGELFGDDQGARWAFGHREGEICASSLLKDDDLVRITKFIGESLGWHVDASVWPSRSMRQKIISTYRMETRWSE
jgi:hypothetical protein